jgi:hypothetical protein
MTEGRAMPDRLRDGQCDNLDLDGERHRRVQRIRDEAALFGALERLPRLRRIGGLRNDQVGPDVERREARDVVGARACPPPRT